jgi:hypothetical protein
LSGYETQIEALRKAGEAARTAGNQVSGMDLADAVAAAGSAMPGAPAVQSFTVLGDAWRGDLAGWVAQAEGYADDLDTAANRYTVNEGAAVADLQAAHPGGVRAQ